MHIRPKSSFSFAGMSELTSAIRACDIPMPIARGGWSLTDKISPPSAPLYGSGGAHVSSTVVLPSAPSEAAGGFVITRPGSAGGWSSTVISSTGSVVRLSSVTITVFVVPTVASTSMASMLCTG